MAPPTASDGIHESDTTSRSIRIAGIICGPATRREGTGTSLPVVLVPPRTGLLAPCRRRRSSGGMGRAQFGAEDAMEKGRSSGAGITVFLADDNLLVRVGVRALLQRQPDLEHRRRGRRLRRVGGRGRGRQPRRHRHRHPDAPDLPARRHRGGQGGAQAPPRHRCRRAVAVRRPGVRRRPAGRGLRRLRLPPQGPAGRGRRTGRRHPGGGDRRHRARPGHRRRPRAARRRRRT